MRKAPDFLSIGFSQSFASDDLLRSSICHGVEIVSWSIAELIQQQAEDFSDMCLVGDVELWKPEFDILQEKHSDRNPIFGDGFFSLEELMLKLKKFFLNIRIAFPSEAMKNIFSGCVSDPDTEIVIISSFFSGNFPEPVISWSCHFVSP